LNTLRSLRNLDNLSIEELIGILKVHELKLQKDNEGKKEKPLSLHARRSKSLNHPEPPRPNHHPK